MERNQTAAEGESAGHGESAPDTEEAAPAGDGYWWTWGVFLALLMAVLFSPWILSFAAHALAGFNG